MSSFLMNSYSTSVDPKFPPTEEYNQSSYIPSPNTADFFHQQSNQQQQYGGNYQQYANYPTPTYYHHPVHHAVQPQQHNVYHMHQSVPPPIPCVTLPVQNQSIPVTLQSAASMAPNLPVINGGERSPPLSHIQHSSPESPSTTADQHSNLGDYIGEDESGPDDDDSNSDNNDTDRVIYPWMKKIHVAGVGEFIKCIK
jgi:homeobox protein HoxA/B/C/D4